MSASPGTGICLECETLFLMAKISKLYLTCLNICGNDNRYTSQQTTAYLYHQTWSKAAEFHCQHLQTWWRYHGSRVSFWKTFVIENRTWGHPAALIRLFKMVSKISDQMKLLLTPHSKTTHVLFTLTFYKLTINSERPLTPKSPPLWQTWKWDASCLSSFYFCHFWNTTGPIWKRRC